MLEVFQWLFTPDFYNSYIDELRENSKTIKRGIADLSGGEKNVPFDVLPTFVNATLDTKSIITKTELFKGVAAAVENDISFWDKRVIPKEKPYTSTSCVKLRALMA